MSNISKFTMALVGLLVTVILASRQIFLLAVLRDPGQTYHLWLVIGAGIIACVTGALMFRFFSGHQNNKWSKVVMTPAGPLTITIGGSSNTCSPPPISFDPIHRALASAWLSEGQANDRTPMDGSVADRLRPPSEQRAFARRSHQLMFKKWSGERHN